MSDVRLMYVNATDRLYVTIAEGVASQTVTHDGVSIRVGPGGRVLGFSVADALERAGQRGGLAINVPNP